MKDYQREFFEFCITSGVLRFGSFTLKSGRVSPYFFNAGMFNTGQRLVRLGGFYAQALQQSGLAYDMLFGPAYKGIPLACAAAMALSMNFDRDVPYAFNRKEAKMHAEGGRIVGHPLQGQVLIIDDVISAGLSVGESVDLIRQAGAVPAGVVIALNRQERGLDSQSAVDEVESKWGIRVTAIATLDNLMTFLGEQRNMQPQMAAMAAYRAEFGA